MMYKRQVQYYETDKMGIVHHSNYIRWFEEARIDYMRQNGIDYNVIEKQEHLMMPVVAVDCKYKTGAQYGDIVAINTDITLFNGVKLIFSYTVLSEDDNVLATGTSTHCFVDMDFKPVRIKKDNVNLYNKLCSLLKE